MAAIKRSPNARSRRVQEMPNSLRYRGIKRDAFDHGGQNPPTVKSDLATGSTLAPRLGPRGTRIGGVGQGA